MSKNEEEDIISELIEEKILTLTQSECIALMKECAYSWISYKNPIAVEVVRRIRKFADGEV